MQTPNCSVNQGVRKCGNMEKNWEVGIWARGKREHTVLGKGKGWERTTVALEREEEKAKELKSGSGGFLRL